MNRQQKIEFLRNIANGIVPLEALAGPGSSLDIGDYLVITGQVNNKTTIHPEVQELIASDLRLCSGNPPRRLCYIDENNQIRNGINYRKNKI